MTTKANSRNIEDVTGNVATLVELLALTGMVTDDVREVTGIGQFQYNGVDWVPTGPFVTLTAFGADITGVASFDAALASAVSYLTSKGGGTIYGSAGHIYRLASDYTIAESNITIDLRGGTLSGAGTLIFSGENGTDNNWDTIENCWFKNALVGTGVGSTTETPRFIYCSNSGMDNVHRHSYGNTGVNMAMCKNTHYTNMSMRGGKDSGGGAFAALMLHCEDSTFQDMVAYEGPFLYTYQIKGGNNCKGIRCHARDVIDGATIQSDYVCYIRGDAPWSTSGSGAAYSYPYPTGSWGAPDEQRASRNCFFEDCQADNVDPRFAAFHAQEFVDSGFINSRDFCTSGTGFVGSKLAGGSERGFVLRGCKGKRLTLNLAFAGVSLVSSDTSLLAVRDVSDNEMEGYGYSGYLLRNCDVTVSNNKAKNTCGNGSGSYTSAFQAELGTKVRYIGNNAVDDRAVKFHSSAYSANSTCPAPLAEGNHWSGVTSRPFAFARPGKFGANIPSELFHKTTDGVGFTAAMVVAPASKETVWIEASVTGVAASGTIGMWKIGGFFKNVAGTVTQEGATVSLITAFNPDSWGGVSFQVISNSVRITIAGKASTSITWTGDLRMSTTAFATHAGTHTGANNASVLTDSSQSWATNELVGATITNTTDGSSATVTANTATTVTATLAGGTDNDWDTSDAYTIT